MKLGKRGIWKKIVSSPATLIIAVVIFVFLGKVVWNMRERLASSKARLETSQMELSKLEDHRSALANKIQYLSTEQGIEAELRTKYRAVREGESVAVIVENDQMASAMQASASTSGQSVTKKGWWGRLVGFFGFDK